MGGKREPADNVVAPFVARERAVGDSDGECADVVSDHAVRHVDVVSVRRADLALRTSSKVSALV